jgi:hypothetical protein
VIGHVNASAARWLAPLAFRTRPGGMPPATWRLFGPHGYQGEEADHVYECFDRSGPGSASSVSTRSRTRLQQLELDGPLRSLNVQLGFYRNMATALLLATLVVVGWTLVGRNHLPWLAWTGLGSSRPART